MRILSQQIQAGDKIAGKVVTNVSNNLRVSFEDGSFENFPIDHKISVS